MARPSAILGLCLCALVSYAAASGASGGPTGNRPTTFAELDSVKGQWSITMEATKTDDKDTFQPQVCDAPAFGAPCNQPPLTADHHDKIKITAKLSAANLTTASGAAPLHVMIRMCFSKPFTADRPWRKPADVIDKDRACPNTIATLPMADNNTYTAVWTLPKAVPKATWYAQVLVECGGADGPVVCQLDSANTNFVATNIINSTPTSMKVAVAVCSAVAPTFLAAFFIKERVMKKRS